MKIVLVVCICLMLSMVATSGSSADLSVGDSAPDFELVGSDGKTYKLSDIETAVVVAWYPKAFTGG